ncbi:MAG: DPP IV N-terminal domain-containing protein [Phycisphaerae bacterium]|nr:DPP IV N-terminal domain-containing protein [Phycisphaerae bacterium]
MELFWLDRQGKRRSYGKVPAGGERTQHTFAGHVWLVVSAKGKPLGVFEARKRPALVEITGKPVAGRSDPSRPGRPKDSPGRSRSAGRSPDGRWTASVKDDNVWIREISTGKEFALSTDGKPEDRYEGRFYWSPDSKYVVALRVRPAEEHKVYVVESSPRDQVQPKLHSYNYHKPGDRIAVSKPCLFDVPGRKQVQVSDALFPNPWSIKDIRWAADSTRFTFVYNQRGHQVLRVLAVKATDGSVRAIVDEKSETFIHYSGKYFLRWLDETGELIWMSERDGWNHLYLYDAVSGEVKNQITKGKWLVRGVDRVDTEKRRIRFRAGGIRPGQDPYYIHYAHVDFDGRGLVVLTRGDGTHSIEYSPDGRYFIDRYSRVDLPPVTQLGRTSDGELICELERADWGELLKVGWKPPIRFTAKGRDGKTNIHGVIYRPAKFDPKAKYPVIECIYAGPHGSTVPKGFRDHYGPQSTGELGFILVQIDGMGTSNRSKAFHDVCWKNLADAGLPDRVLWMKAAARKYPFMDITRVGIYGGSAGGQNAAAAVMTHGDFYKVAVADCGCHDNRMDKIWWNEQWMGWPVGPHYPANSNVTLAKGLKGKLLLIVGELDRNVDPASTMQVVNALIEADKDFDLLVIPGAGHGAAGSRYGRRRQADYFVRHLLGVEPRSQ